MIAFLRTLFARPSWHEVFQRKYDTPEAICIVVREFVRYKPDRKDEWAHPSVTWARGHGDCEDIALVIHELCWLCGFPSFIKVYFPLTIGRAGHAVVIGDGWWASNGEYHTSVHTINRVMARALGVREESLTSVCPNDLTLQKLIGAPA